ncbi:SEC-C metal-binding domain-containing protein [Kribbella sp. NPDC055071]
MDDPLGEELRDHWIGTALGRTLSLLIIASEHVRERRPERAAAIWEQLIREGGATGDVARVDYADFLFEEGRDTEASSELDAVMTNNRIYSFAWRSAAELLERRGELEEALLWYEIAADQLTAEDVTSGSPRIQDLVTGRRRVKWALRLPLDGLDLMGEEGDDEAVDREGELRASLREPTVHEGRIEVWDRGEFDEEVPWRRHFIGENADAYCQMVERVLRAQPHRVMIATWTYGGMLDCLENARLRHDELPDGRRIVWPPPRNTPCWCGSELKYKKCCGGPLPPPEPGGRLTAALSR